MIILAAMTVAFPPGTFVATFFAMPLFEWDAFAEGMVVPKRFRICWAVTVPYTSLTLLIWVLLTGRRRKSKGFQRGEIGGSFGLILMSKGDGVGENEASV